MAPIPRAIALIGSQELFRLAGLVIALGVALATHATGLSLGLGAFPAGIVVSESERDEQAITPSSERTKDGQFR